MKHISTASRTENKMKRKKSLPQKCQHLEVYAVAAFVDDMAKEAWLLQVCEHCGENFLLMGQYPMTIC